MCLSAEDTFEKTLDGLGFKKSDPKQADAAAARFKAMEERHKPKHDEAPKQPAVTAVSGNGRRPCPFPLIQSLTDTTLRLSLLLTSTLPLQEEVFNANLSSTDKRTGLSLPSPLQLFVQYDQDKTGGINRNEFGQMLFDLDSLEDVPKAKRDDYIKKEFMKADLNRQALRISCYRRRNDRPFLALGRSYPLQVTPSHLIFLLGDTQ